MMKKDQPDRDATASWIVVRLARDVLSGVILSSALLVGGCSKKEEWVRVERNGAGFSVSMPDYPVEKTNFLDFESGRLAWVHCSAARGETVFGVTYGEYPDVIMTNITTDRILASGLERLMAGHVFLRKLQDSTGRFQDYPCKDFAIEDSAMGYTMTGKIVLAGRRMYVVQAVGPTTDSGNRDAHRFIDSFRISPASR